MSGDWNTDSWLVLVTLIFSLASFVIQLYLLKKGKKKSNKEHSDEECIQNFIYSVGSYLENMQSKIDVINPNYKAMAADIYRHIPQKYWNFAEKIDQAIFEGRYTQAWETLKLFSQAIASNEAAF